MLTKWERKGRPTKFMDYITTPSRFDLVSMLVGNYNFAWSFQQVADAVAMRYANAEQHLRAEMVTSTLIAHRRGRMVNNFEGWDTDSVVQRLLAQIGEPKGEHYAYTYNWETNQRVPVWSA